MELCEIEKLQPFQNTNDTPQEQYPFLTISDILISQPIHLFVSSGDNFWMN